MKAEQRKLLDRSRPRVSILDRSPEVIMDFLRSRLEEKGVKEAYVFGSLATKNLGAWSDIDLIIVQESELPFLDRVRAFETLFDLGIPVDILVYTPDELSRLWSSDSTFWKQIRKESLRLI